MKFNKKILEAVNKGVKLALDDFDDIGQTLSKSNIIDVEDVISDYVHGGFVDLGLPSRTLWCKCNLGAKHETQYGDLYAWGEIETKKSYNNENYKHYHVDIDMSEFDKEKYSDFAKRVQYEINHMICKLTKYSLYKQEGYNGYVDKLTQLQPEDDVATQLRDHRYSIPTDKDFRELIKYTDVKYVNEENGYKGWKCINKYDPSKYIFFPLAGYKAEKISIYGGNKNRIEDEKKGCYWTSTVNDIDPYNALMLEIDYSYSNYNSGNGYVPGIHSSLRWYGLSIRPVLKTNYINQNEEF